MRREEKEHHKYYIESLTKETNRLARLMEELHKKSRRLWSLLDFFYQYGFKKMGVTPEEETLRSIMNSINKSWVNEYEEIFVTIEDVQFLLEIVRQMCTIRYLVNKITDGGYNIGITGNKWYVAGRYLY